MTEPQPSGLSERELDILRLVATGASNKEIAQRLAISSNTVKVHLRNIFAKIGAASRTEAAMYAVSIGLVPQLAQDGGQNSLSEQAIQTNHNELVNEGYSSVASGIPEKPISSPRRRATVLLLAFGFLLVIGVVSLAAAYMIRAYGRAPSPTPSPSASPHWQVLATMPTARYSLAVAAYENRIYAIAGKTSQGATDLLERYDPATDSWTVLSKKPTSVEEVSAGVIGGKIYVPGGRLSSNEPTNVLEIYDPRQDAWSQGKPLPVNLSAYALAVYEGKLYLFGGWDGHRYLDAVYEYDPEQDAWNTKSPMSQAKGYAGAAVAAGKIFIVGGYDGDQALASNETYQPNIDDGHNNPWSKSAPLPLGRYAMGVTSIADIIQIVGGVTDKNQASISLEYFPQTDSWQELGYIGGHTLGYPGLVSLGTYLYILGGKFDNAPTSQNLSYQAIYTIMIPLVR